MADSGAKFSEDKKYRYYLWRIWDRNKPFLMYIGLNPSTANEIKNDKTITKIAKITKHNGYGGFFMFNLYAIVSTDPAYLVSHINPVGENDSYFDAVYVQCKDVVFCWGNFKEAIPRAELLIKLIPAPLCLHQNKNGSPKHPLYCKDESILQPFYIKMN